jgi:hypothetical protein
MEDDMSDLFDRVTGAQDFFKKILGKIPGFKGYIERQNRRSADKLLRETIANQFEAAWQRISNLQIELVNQGAIEYLDDVERAAIKLRQFTDRVRTASYGYSGFFDAVKVNEKELAAVYEYDLTLLELSEEVGRAIDNLEASIGTDGLPASIRNLVSLTQKCVDAFNHRRDVMMLGSADETASGASQ